MPQLYEIHLTIDTKDAELATRVSTMLKWKTSEIARDPVLGNKNFFYLTKYTENLEDARIEIVAAKAALFHLGVNLLREKIEHIVHDIRYQHH